MKTQKFLFLFLLISIFASCHKDIDDTSIIEGERPNPTVFTQKVGTIYGYVYNAGDNSKENNPEKGIKITLPTGETTQTDEYGVFIFKNVKLDPHGTYIKAEKESGYRFLGSDYVYPTSGIIHSYIQLIPTKHEDGRFQASQGATINVKGGGKIIFSPNSIMDENENDFNGDVLVFAKRLSTDDKKLGDKMPGELRGSRINGNTVVLSSFGMVAVQLFDEARNPLNLKANSTAKLISPITNAQLSDAPEEIPMWYFDEHQGLWIEEGTAMKIGNNYEADVAHFSWWNCDAPFPVVHLCVKVKYSDGTPANNFEVHIENSLNAGRNGYTDTEGEVCGKVAKNTALTLTVFDPLCSTPVKTIEIGPFDNDVVLDDIVLDIVNPLGNGVVTCNADPVDNAVVVIDFVTASNTGTLIIPVNDSGEFDMDIDNSICDALISADIFAYNPSTGEASPSQSLDIENPQTINLNICTDCEFMVTIEAENDPVCTAEIVKLNAVSSGVGNYEYTWSNGETTKDIAITENGIYCVTVTDTNANCSNTNCYEIANDYLIIESTITKAFCGENNGKISITINGGTPPYSYTWSDGQTGPTTENIAAGTYTITVVDAKGCSRSETFTVENITDLEFQIFNETWCGQALLFPSGLPQNINTTFEWTGPNGYSSTVEQPTVFESGEYCATASFGNCSTQVCVDLVIDGEIPIHPSLIRCENNIYTYINNNNYPVLPYSNNTSGEEVNPFEEFPIDVTKFGYSFFLEEPCQDQEEYFLPNYIGEILDSKSNTTCTTCDDGFITFVANLNQNCRECNIGSTAIYKIDDLTIDLSTQNDTHQLAAGEYYMVVKDVDTKCWIAHKKVIID